MNLEIGSVLLSAPNRIYIKKTHSYVEWDVPFNKLDSEEELVVIKKTKLDSYRRTLIWIEVFSSIFPNKIVDDAKRIAYDMRFDGILKNCAPSFYAMICFYLSCKFHEFNFMSVADEIMKLKGEGREAFGLKRRKYSTRGKHIQMLEKYSKHVHNLMPDKFENLRNMWAKLEGLNE